MLCGFFFLSWKPIIIQLDVDVIVKPVLLFFENVPFESWVLTGPESYGHYGRD